MAQDNNAQDPLEFVRGMWSSMGFNLPGMVTPTLDVDELDKRITDLKAVENWLKMNLNMLQMTTQGLEVQRAAIAAVKAMSQQMQGDEGGAKSENPFAGASMWPWNLMQQQASQTPAPETSPTPASPAGGSGARRKTSTGK